MKIIESAYINALLADAAYTVVNPNMLETALIDAAKDRLTPTQANHLAANFTVLSSIESPKALGSGFDAVVWQGKTGTPYAGQVFVSMRGTQGLEDIADDIGLAASGVPITQVVDMVNWWQRISTPQGQQAQQIQFQTESGYTKASPIAGTGEIAAGTRITSVNGHSLGGYLATAFTRLFGNQADVQSVSTFNSAGFSNAAALNIRNSFDQIANELGLNGSFASTNSKQTNYFGVNGIEFTTNSLADLRLPGFNQYGGRTALEQEGTLGSDPINNHYMYKLTDYLALGAALEKLDPSLNFSKLNALIKAGSNDMAASYEGVFDAVRKALAGSNVERLPIGDVSNNAESRAIYHATLVDFQNNPIVKGLAGQLLIRPAGADLKAAARNDFGALVALQDLSPLWITGKNGAADAQLATLWQASRSADYSAWQLDRTTDTPTTYTDAWLADRAAMLQKLVERNNADVDAQDPVSPFNGRNTLFQDADTDSRVEAGAISQAGNFDVIAFGKSGDDAAGELSGAAGNDHLYGMGGNDYLLGYEGNDYLEGGTGNDQLNGGGGNDRLIGGKDFDTYAFTGTFGKDTITDSDGQGVVQIDGHDIGTAKGAGMRDVWVAQTATGEYVGLAVYDSGSAGTSKSLVITRAGSTANTITIKNFNLVLAKAGGYLGIKLGTTQEIALLDHGGANVFTSPGFDAGSLGGNTSTVGEECAQLPLAIQLIVPHAFCMRPTAKFGARPACKNQLRSAQRHRKRACGIGKLAYFRVEIERKKTHLSSKKNGEILC